MYYCIPREFKLGLQGLKKIVQIIAFFKDIAKIGAKSDSIHIHFEIFKFSNM